MTTPSGLCLIQPQIIHFHYGGWLYFWLLFTAECYMGLSTPFVPCLALSLPLIKMHCLQTAKPKRENCMQITLFLARARCRWSVTWCMRYFELKSFPCAGVFHSDLCPVTDQCWAGLPYISNQPEIRIVLSRTCQPTVHKSSLQQMTFAMIHHRIASQSPGSFSLQRIIKKSPTSLEPDGI